MATWTSLGSATLYDGANQNLGSVNFEYDSASTSGTTWPARLRNQNSGTFWTGNLSAGSKTATWTCPWYNGSKNYSITGTLPAKSSAPTGLYINNVSSTWNSVTGTVGLSSYGNGSGTKVLEMLVLTQSYVPGLPHRLEQVTDGSMSKTFTVSNSSAYPAAGSIDIKGAGTYYTGAYASNGSEVSRYAGGSIATPPSPLQSITYSATDIRPMVVALTLPGRLLALALHGLLRQLRLPVTMALV